MTGGFYPSTERDSVAGSLPLERIWFGQRYYFICRINLGRPGGFFHSVTYFAEPSSMAERRRQQQQQQQQRQQRLFASGDLFLVGLHLR